MGSGTQRFVGAYVATGAAFSIEKIGFKPAHVRLFNWDDPSFMEHFEGMPDASFALQKAGSSSKVTSQGITLTDNGFDVGTNADLNTAGETIHFVAVR